MSYAVFYLFDVHHGQCAALVLPNGLWCIFDLGRTQSFSPIKWITRKVPPDFPFLPDGLRPKIRFLHSTISHYHGDHLADFSSLKKHTPDRINSVIADRDYLVDSLSTCSDDEGKRLIMAYSDYYSSLPSCDGTTDYSGASILEKCLSVVDARSLGGSANSRVNNASIVTRIDIHGNSILLCGDMEKEGWEYALEESVYWYDWRSLCKNIDILVAPHHGHKSGYSTKLMALAKPKVVLVSAKSGDTSVYGQYSNCMGIMIGKERHYYISTRDKGHIKITISLNGKRKWSFGDKALI